MTDTNPTTPTPAWHTLSASKVSELQHVDITSGLADEEIKHRHQRYGPNAILTKEGRGPWLILLQQFSDFMIIVLIIAAIVSGLVGEPQDATAIVIIVILNAVVGFVQDYRAERALAALKKLAAPTATVRRNGQIEVIPADQLVPGDVVILEDGNLIPADLRLSHIAQLQVNEAALTGESQPPTKSLATWMALI